jgi:long-chain fatty acid transport protein
MKRLLAISVLLAASLCVTTAAMATNGMNLEGYGPISTGMGGASMAYDNGAAAVMNNPATIGMMPDGNRLDVAFGYLGPHVKSSMPGMPDAKSSADAFFMPAIGWVARSGKISYGVGMFSQGGMGTEYDSTSFLAMGSGDLVRSELGVGRVIIPLVFNITPDFTVGGSIDYVWASLDLKMAASGAQLGQMVTACSGGGCLALPALGGAPWARIDFSDGGSFSGSATGSGYAGKLGATYRFGKAFSVGAVYQSKTSLSDLETKDTGAVMSAAGAGVVGLGKISVRNFEWPETYGLGVAVNPTDRFMIAFDVKRINWHNVMKSFKMTYEGGIFGAPTMINFEMPQNWKDQTVYELGLGYKFTNEFTGRIGANIANNPIPDLYLNPLFPAIEKNHYTIGAGYMVSKTSSVDASFTYAPNVSVTNGQGVKVEHNQTNAQVMYSYRF